VAEPAGASRANQRWAAPEVYKLAYEESKRSLDSQTLELDSLRQRAVQFLAFIGAGTAFLVGSGLAVDARPFGFYLFSIAGTILLIIAMLVLGYVLFPLHRVSVSTSGDKSKKRLRVAPWRGRLSGARLIAEVDRDIPKATEEAFTAALVKQYDRMLTSNLLTLKAVRRAYVTFVFCSVLELACWVIVVWSYR
jgi:hypothetical protein